MGINTKIEWCDMTFNPWHGCAKVSAGCKFCYAETFTKRYSPGENFWGVDGNRRFFNDKHWEQPLRWNRRAERKGRRYRVFCGSMCDVFEDRFDLIEPRNKLFDLIHLTPYLDWLLLTKRPENIEKMFDFYDKLNKTIFHLHNIWLGTSVENQEQADLRIPELLTVPAKIHFLSCEPLLEEIQVSNYLVKLDISNTYYNKEGEDITLLAGSEIQNISWIIVGGESGNVDRIRPMKDEWAMSLIQECKAANVPVFIKQLGTRKRLTGKGQHMNEWPKELRIREFPE